MGVGLLSITAGTLLLIGLLTPIAGFLVGMVRRHRVFLVSGSCLDLVRLQAGEFLSDHDGSCPGFFGPGAFSLDCHLFGRREIIIPPTVRSRKS
jgi:hypothetical protein